ncbi:MAG: hypothetical protein PHC43_07360 [Candidatus Marinimicrobia bacterium]|nr:hypothetical protein [Candidatus Neomarinimicrobiota bacterium]
MFEPLCIRAYIQTGIISDQFLPLDGILLYHAIREQFGHPDIALPGEDITKGKLKFFLPLAIENEGRKDWFYHCSFARWAPDMREDQQSYCRRFDLKYSDLIDFQGRSQKVNLSSARYKNYFVKVYYRIASWVEWYALGERAEIERFLPFLTHLGKKSSQGWGAVLRWEVEPIESDWSIRNVNCLPMRAIPAEQGFLYGIRPPYWESDNQFICEMPE